MNVNDNFFDFLKFHESAVQKHLENLKEKGLLRRIGADRGGYWEVVRDE